MHYVMVCTYRNLKVAMFLLIEKVVRGCCDRNCRQQQDSGDRKTHRSHSEVFLLGTFAKRTRLIIREGGGIIVHDDLFQRHDSCILMTFCDVSDAVSKAEGRNFVCQHERAQESESCAKHI